MNFRHLISDIWLLFPDFRLSCVLVLFFPFSYVLFTFYKLFLQYFQVTYMYNYSTIPSHHCQYFHFLFFDFFRQGHLGTGHFCPLHNTKHFGTILVRVFYPEVCVLTSDLCFLTSDFGSQPSILQKGQINQTETSPIGINCFFAPSPKTVKKETS